MDLNYEYVFINLNSNALFNGTAFAAKKAFSMLNKININTQK